MTLYDVLAFISGLIVLAYATKEGLVIWRRLLSDWRAYQVDQKGKGGERRGEL